MIKITIHNKCNHTDKELLLPHDNNIHSFITKYWSRIKNQQNVKYYSDYVYYNHLLNYITLLNDYNKHSNEIYVQWYDELSELLFTDDIKCCSFNYEIMEDDKNDL